MTSKVNFIIQEFKNKKKRKTNTISSDIIFMYYITETLSKPLSQIDRKKIFGIYKKLFNNLSTQL